MNLKKEIIRIFETMFARWVFRAVVTGTSGNLVTIRRYGQTNPDAQSYARLSSYTAPATNDEVVVIWVGGYFVLGKITR